MEVLVIQGFRQIVVSLLVSLVEAAGRSFSWT